MKLYKNNDYYTNTLHIVEVKRVQNDIYGNPLYRIYPISFLFKPLTCVYKNYANTLKPYYLVKSYNIEQTLQEMFKELEYTVLGKQFTELTGYERVYVYQDEKEGLK